MDEKTLLAKIAELEKQNAALALKAIRGAKGYRMKVSPKGALSVYGFGQWPVTLYKEQWIKVFALKQDIEKFITDNAASLKSKADSQTPTTPETK